MSIVTLILFIIFCVLVIVSIIEVSRARGGFRYSMQRES